MNRKMLVVMIAKTRAVLAAVSRHASGEPAAPEVVGDFLVARFKDSALSLAVPVEDLSVKEVDYRDEVFRTPRAHVVDDSNAVVVSQNRVTNLSVATGTNGQEVTLTLSPTTVPADKDVVLIVDAGPNAEPLRFAGKTVLNRSPVIPVSGVPSGPRLVLGSVAGFNSRLEPLSF